MKDAIVAVNTEYQQQIDTAKASVAYDDLEMSGSRAVWPEVLSVYLLSEIKSRQPGDPDAEGREGSTSRTL